MNQHNAPININEVNKTVGYRVKERRINLGYSRADIALHVGVSQQQFEKYEKGLNRISAGMLAAISTFLKVDPSYFFQDIETGITPTENQRMALELTRNFLSIKNPKHQKLVVMTTKILSESS